MAAPLGYMLNPGGLANEFKFVSYTHTTVAAVDTIAAGAFGLRAIVGALVSLNDDASDALYSVSVTFTGPTLTIKTWKTDGSDPTPVAATAFSKLINVIVFGY